MNFSKENVNDTSLIKEQTKPIFFEMDCNSSNVWPQQAAASTHQESTSENMLLNTSPLSTSSNGNGAEMRSNDSGDAEGVWSADIDQAFHEALQIYPPCGRRKIILSDEGKMYGRNELIARYIKIRCGKTRTRKQVSSHIQVLARKKQREEQARLKAQRESSVTENSNQKCQSNSVVEPISPDIPVGNGRTLEDINSAQQNSSIVNQPLADLITSVNRDQIASMQAQMLKAASALSMGRQNVNWPYPLNTNTNNLLGNYILSGNSNSNGIGTSIPTPSLRFDQNYAAKNSSQQYPLPESEMPFGTSTSSFPNNLTIASSKLVLNEFTAYIEQNIKETDKTEHRKEIVHIPKTTGVPLEKIGIDLIQSKYPSVLQELFRKGPVDAFFLVKCWANMNFEVGDEQNSLFAVDSYYESTEKFDIVVSTKVCSFGKEVVEKVEIYAPIDDMEEVRTSGKWHFRLERSPMCEYMVRFISELKKLHEPSLMNSVLENFTVLQIVTNKQTNDTLMTICFIFEIREDGEDDIYTHIYRLTESTN